MRQHKQHYEKDPRDDHAPTGRRANDSMDQMDSNVSKQYRTGHARYKAHKEGRDHEYKTPWDELSEGTRRQYEIQYRRVEGGHPPPQSENTNYQTGHARYKAHLEGRDHEYKIPWDELSERTRKHYESCYRRIEEGFGNQLTPWNELSPETQKQYEHSYRAYNKHLNGQHDKWDQLSPKTKEQYRSGYYLYLEYMKQKADSNSESISNSDSMPRNLPPVAASIADVAINVGLPIVVEFGCRYILRAIENRLNRRKREREARDLREMEARVRDLEHQRDLREIEQSMASIKQAFAERNGRLKQLVRDFEDMDRMMKSIVERHI